VIQKLCLVLVLLCIASQAHAQLKPEDLDRDYLVKLVMKDSSSFYAVVLAKPLPDRIIAETRNGRLEIPLAAIDYALDYRFNFVMKEDLRKIYVHNTVDNQSTEVTKYLSRPKLPDVSTVSTKDHDTFKGRRYLFNDSAHVILFTPYGNLFFTYPKLERIENYSGQNDTKEEFYTTSYLESHDPRSSQAFITPNAMSFGAGNAFISDYLLAGLQFNYGPTDWLSLNGGGVFAPFLPTQVLTGTLGLKVTPYQSAHVALAAGVQGVYSDVVKITRIAFPYAVATYGTWESNISLLGGVSYKRENDSLNQPYTAVNSVIALSGGLRVGENLKASAELFFISDFNIIPIVFTLRYFQNDLTIDAGVVFSAYKAGAARVTKTLGEYVFNTSFEIIPLVSMSYHF
jgi:hypothetical protein